MRSHSAGLCSRAVGILLFEVLGLEEKDISLLPCGKPYVRDGRCKFSISHSGNTTVLAVCKSEVGADIEAVNEKRIAVAEKACCPEEREWMSLNPCNRFFQIWTMKEALSKATGKGLGMSFGKINVLPLLFGGTFEYEKKHYYGSCFLLSGSVLSVVSEKSIGNVRFIDISSDEQFDFQTK